MLLAKAYETQENNICTAENYKESLKANPENFEAFDRLIGNYLLTHNEKIEFLNELKFDEESKWIQDYYRSRVQEELVTDLQGHVVINEVDPVICSPDSRRGRGKPFSSSGIEYTSPYQVKSFRKPEDFNDEDKKTQQVLTILKLQNNSYIKLIEAEKFYNSHSIHKAYKISK